MRHFLGVDVETWAMNPVFRDLDSSARKRVDGGAVAHQINQLLALLLENHQRITWFVAAEVYDWYPDRIDAIAKAGHEIAYHTYSHPEPVTAPVLERELAQSRRFLKAFCPTGFRAPHM